MSFPTLPPKVPSRGNRLSMALARGFMRLFGWSVEGEFPDRSKLMLIGAPHTSNWDFVFGMAAMFSIGLRISWMGKASIFKRPFAGILHWMGGIAIERTSRQGWVSSMVEEFERRDGLVVGLAPEGTRSKVDRWRSGFWHIARGAELPIIPVYLDYPRKVLGIGPAFEPTADLDADLEALQSYYSQFSGKWPSKG